MRTLIIYYSAYKMQTEKIAELFSKKTAADMVNLNNSQEINIDNYDLIGFGSGVYRESMAQKLFSLVKKLNLKNKDVFVFSTSGSGMKYYHTKLMRLLKTKGAKCKGSFACKGSFISKDFSDNQIFEFMSRFAQGHPNEKDFTRAERFIEKITT